MAWNPHRHVAAARDAAKQLDDASLCVVVWVTKDGSNLGIASYGKTKALCDEASKLADHLYAAANNWGES